MLTRRHFFRWLFGFSVLPLFPVSLRGIEASDLLPQKEGRRVPISEYFKGEELHYEIGVWMFKRVALGKLSFKETDKKGIYMGLIEGETLGVLGWAARYRTDTYRAMMEEVEGGGRFRALSFEEDVKIGTKLRRKTHLFDYQKRKWTQIRQRKDGSLERTEGDIPPGMVYDDFLTASYNFRYGAYGEIERGKRYTVATFPRKGATHYEVRVAEKAEEEKKRKSEKGKEGRDFFIKLLLDPEVTHSKEGLIEGWLSKEIVPTEGSIKDVVLFGDVKGTLVKNSRG